jgi:DNA-binding HxlR family transcriptional regulator
MRSSREFCPIAKAAEIICERWTLLVVRELLLGSRHFNDFQRGLPHLSPGLLTKRLRSLEEAGVLTRVQGSRGIEYRPTLAGEELRPLVTHAGQWGARWVRSRLLREELNAGSLMWYVHRHFRLDALPPRRIVVHVHFSDEKRLSRWWIVLTPEGGELCMQDPGFDVDVYINTDVRTLTAIYLGDTDLRRAMADRLLTAVGPRDLVRDIHRWFARSRFADVVPASGRERRMLAPITFEPDKPKHRNAGAGEVRHL